MGTPTIKPARCLLVQPRFDGRTFWNFSEVCKFAGAKYPDAPLGLMTVAAMLPDNWALRLVDENVRILEERDLEWADIVLTGGMLQQRKGILGLINRAHARSKTIAVGGPDPTSQPGIYATADFLVLGEGEETIPLFIEDLGKNVKSGDYRSLSRADMTEAVVPRFDLINFSDYLHVGVQFSRGCPHNCEFCDIVEMFGRHPRNKTSQQILKELQALHDLGYRGQVGFVDDNFIGNRSKATELLTELKNWAKRNNYPFFFNVQASINLAEEKNILQLMKDNDFRSVCVGIETQNQDLLEQTKKFQNRGVSVIEAVRRFNFYGLDVIGCFILGFDNEPHDTAGKTIKLIQEAGICMSMVTTLIALPNTRLSRRLEKEGRLFSRGKFPALTLTDGLNFVTTRPHTEILMDQIRVLQHIYNAKEYYKRLTLTAMHLRPDYKFSPDFFKLLKAARIFIKVSCKVGFSRPTAAYYWKTLFKVMIKNPKAIEAAGRLSIIYLHFRKQAQFVIDTIKEKIWQIEDIGETAYNTLMLGNTRKSDKQ